MENLKILLVDDDAFSRKMYSDILLEDGFSVISVQSAEEALTTLKKGAFDVLLSDYILEGMDGITLCKKARVTYPALDCIIMTAHGTVESAVEALKFGVSDYLLKPINPEELKLTVKRIKDLKNVVEENSDLKTNNKLMKLLNTLSLCLEPDQLSLTSVNLLSNIFDCDSCAFLEFDKRKSSFSLKNSKGLTKSELQVFPEIISKLHSGWKSRFAKVKVVKSPLLKRNLKKISKGFSSFLIIPLILRKSLYGTIILVKKKNSSKFNAKILKTAKTLSEHLSRTLENCLRFIKAKELAFVDELTGLYNTRYLDYFMDKEIKRARRQNYPLSFLFMDIDHFKSVNDTHGHLVGSRILVEMGKIIKKCVRDIDIIVRYGGDEYIIILVNTLPEGAHLVGDRLRALIEDNAFQKENNLNIRLTASFGIATYPIHANSKEAVVNLADKAMYKAKTTSRNAVYLATEILG